jgi:hypothetical protein
MSLQVTPDISIRNILFATDFSSCSEAALPYAIGVSRRYCSRGDLRQCQCAAPRRTLL